MGTGIGHIAWWERLPSMVMTRIFGEVAALYDDVRPGYPAAVLDALRDRVAPARVVELGAGTGKGTAVLAALGAPLTALEPDPRMAAVLRAKFPAVDVVETTFEQWPPPAGGVDLIGCAMAWHWMDPATRNRRAFDALTPGGTLAVFGHKYGYRDPAQSAAVLAVLHRVDPAVADRRDHWVREDVEAAGIWSHVEEHVWHSFPALPTERYLALMQTFSPFRRRSPEDQRRVLDGLRALVDGFGGEVVLDLRTTLVLARR